MKIEELNLAALKYFLDAVELESITLSSEKNHISRPAVSQAILRLEEWYGKQLLKHEKRSFELTDAGRKFYQLAKRCYGNLQDGLTQGFEPEQKLRVGCPASLVDLIFPKLKPVIDRCPNPSIKVGKTSTLLDLLAQNQIGMAFLIADERTLKFKTRIVHRGHFELRSKNGQWSELIITTEQRPEVNSFLRYAMKGKKNLVKHIEVESWTLAQKLAEMMNGMCLVPDYLEKSSLKTVKKASWKHSYDALLVSQKKELLSELETDLVQDFEV